jgi:release factor glutamine methyltransferase
LSTVRAELRKLTQRLAAAGVPTPEADAALLVRHVLGWSGVELVTRAAEPLPDEGAARLESLAARRAAREPLQLLLGTIGFRHLELEVRPGVFIPRPETEVLAGEAIVRTPAGGTVVEPCTGTGAVACVVAAEADRGRVLATDISPAAVALARANATRCGVDVSVLLGDLLGPVPARLRGAVDVLVCNPPYLAQAELDGLEPEVRHDPLAALVAGPTGDEVITRLLAEALHWLRPGGWLVLELDTRRALANRRRAAACGFADVAVVADLTGADRVLVARLPG